MRKEFIHMDQKSVSDHIELDDNTSLIRGGFQLFGLISCFLGVGFATMSIGWAFAAFGALVVVCIEMADHSKRIAKAIILSQKKIE